jgi:phosphoglycolate phosphatase
LSRLAPGLLNFSPRLIIFDKDGTLIDFHAMWSAWIRALAGRLERRLGRPVAGELYELVGFSELTGRAIPGGPLAVTPMAELRSLITSVVRGTGMSAVQAGAVMRDLWFVPDATRVTPLADLRLVFEALCADGIAIAVATSDDRAPAEATLKRLGVAGMVSALVAADESIPAKPAPDMLLHLCANLQVDPAWAVMVGDSVADMQMGHAAGVGACIGVLSGVSAHEDLAAAADIVLPSIAGLIG